MKRIVITCGDPSGIGPEIADFVLPLLMHTASAQYIVIGAGETVPQIAQHFPHIHLDDLDSLSATGFFFCDIAPQQTFPVGVVSPKSGEIAMQSLLAAMKIHQKWGIDALVTLPLCKEAIQKAGYCFLGHTEFLQAVTASDQAIMSFLSPDMNLLLLTTHCALSEVGKRLTIQTFCQKIETAVHQLESTYFSASPRIAILGTNPHAGENGLFGLEDEEIIKPGIELLQEQGFSIEGPFPADTFFLHHALHFDLIVSPYHDQALPVIKLIANQTSVNVTLGLPFVRTSVDHGTAFDIVGKNRADYGSFLAALEMAQTLTDIPQETPSYTVIADFYEQLMCHIHYKKWAQFLANLLFKNGIKKHESLLEIAAGTGNLAEQLHRLGYKQLIATDSCLEMLLIGQKRSPDLQCFQMDMKKLPDCWENQFGAVFCTYDSINYQTNEKLLLQVFQEVHRVLRSGGIFIFDISTIGNSIRYFGESEFCEDLGDYYYERKSDFDRETRLQFNQFTVFKRVHSFWKRYSELHTQKIYSYEEIRRAFEQAGFSCLNVYSSMQIEKSLFPLRLQEEDQLDQDYDRLHFVIKKN